jgi:membrane protein involved in colicin uptake
MKSMLSVGGLVILLYTIFALSSCATQQEEAKVPPAKPAATAEAKKAPAPEKAPAPAKAEAKAPAKAETKVEAKAETKTEAKAKAEKAKGDVGLLDTEKNYLILVTKEGKLITLDFDQKTKATMLESKPAKMADVGLGSSAEVEYVTKGDKKIVTNMEFKAAKGGD